MKGTGKLISNLNRYAFLRWLCFGAVIYVLLLMTVKQDNETLPDLDISIIKHICESSPIFKPSCSCPKRKNLMYQPQVSQYQDYQPPNNAAWNTKEKRHIAFVKTHKAASSTVLNILYRFAKARDLQVLLPRRGNYHNGRYLNKSHILPPPNGKKYDIICNHAIFNYSSWKKFLPEDTVYIGIVREPFERFVSAFYYYRYVHPRQYLSRIPGNHQQVLRVYLKNPLFHEPKSAMASYTNNRMVIDFGFPQSQFNNEEAFNEYLLLLNKTFSLVMVAEHFDQSLVLMRRMLNWTTKDIVYMVKNRSRIKPKLVGIDNLKRNYRPFSHLDQKLYDFFKARFKELISNQGPDFGFEVKQFGAIRKQIANFCAQYGKVVQIAIAKTNWTDALTITRRECAFLKLEELQFLSLIHTRQQISVNNMGYNAKFWKTLPS